MNNSFIKFLESKQQLYRAIVNDPIVKRTYEIKNYCKLLLPESTNLRPRQVVEVKWLYEGIDHPKPLHIAIPSAEISINVEALYDEESLVKWLSSNAREIKNG